jgi:alpha-pyrone synthase
LVAGLIARHTHETMHHFAIHPGGKKILEEVGNALTLPKEKLEPAYDVLMNYGNMSSPSIVFVLKKLLTTGSVKSGENIIGMAFGPGLTMESFLMKRV